MTKTILIAGGTGMIGQEMVRYFRGKGHEARILSRGKTNVAKSIFHWNPKKKEIDLLAIENVTTLINLAGAGIADKKWTSERKKALIHSRVEPAKFITTFAAEIWTLEHYISASGINAYGYKDDQKKYKEEDAFGQDFLSTVVEKWEQAADVMLPFAKVTKVRIGVVLAKEGGALPKIANTVKNYIGAPLGSGKQWTPWISKQDVVRVFEHVMDHQLEGVYNALAGSVTNKQFTQEIAQVLKKPLWLPNVPSFVLKLALGEMASVVLEGLQADHSKLVNTGFSFQHETLNEALKENL